MNTKEIITGWKGHDEALRELDRAEEELDRAGEVVPGYEDKVTDDERREAYEREVYPPRERGEWLKKFYEFRAQAIMNRLMYALRFNMSEPAVKHIWVSADLGKVELRSGNPPSDTDRPEHLKGLDLVVDPARHGPIKPEVFRAYRHLKGQIPDEARFAKVREKLVAEFIPDEQ